MNIPRMFASAFVRRIVFVIVAALCTWAGMGRAEAAIIEKPTRQAAYSAAQADFSKLEPKCDAMAGPAGNIKNARVVLTSQPEYYAKGDCYMNLTAPDVLATVDADDHYRWPAANGGCPVGSPWDEASKTCKTPKDCASEPDLTNKMVKGETGMCVNGCMYSPDIIGLRTIGTGAALMTAATTWGVTGAECTVVSEPKPYDPGRSICQSTGGAFSECIKPDGQHCVTGAAGTKMCWTPDLTAETGPRLNEAGSEGADRQKAPATPTPPPGQQNPTTQTTTTTTIGPSTYNTTIFSGTGNTGGQPNTGPGGSKGPGTGDGTGDGGEGDDEKGTSTGGGDCTAPPVCSGDGILCNINTQGWLQRCAQDGGGATTEPVMGDIDPGIADGIITEGEVIEQELDTSGWGWARSCPAPISVDVFGTQIEFDTNGVLCNWLQLGGALVLMFAGWICLRMMGGVV